MFMLNVIYAKYYKISLYIQYHYANAIMLSVVAHNASDTNKRILATNTLACYNIRPIKRPITITFSKPARAKIGRCDLSSDVKLSSKDESDKQTLKSSFH
jgi:hypothetical protein